LFTILLRVPSLNPRVKVQYEAVIKILDDNELPYEVIDGTGENTFTQVLSLILFGDFTSYYLAILNRVDPTPVPVIDFIKQYMVDYKGG
jgi:glucose/mannose-6-phosphate isomerase